MDSISSAAIPRMNEFKPRELSNPVWAFSKLAVCDLPLMTAISASSIPICYACDFQNLSNIAWAFAFLGIADETLMHAIAAASIAKIRDANCQGISNSAWSFAALRLESRPLLESLAAQAIRTISQFEHQGRSNTPWAFATRAERDGPLFDSIAAQAIRTIQALEHQDLSNSAWSLATLAFRHAPLLASIAASAIRSIREWPQQGLANTAWSFAARVFPDSPLCDSIAASAIPTCRDFLPQGISNTVWSMSTLEVHHAPLRDAISAAALRSIRDFETQELNNTAWAFGYIQSSHPGLSSAIRRTCLARGRDLDSQGEADRLIWRNVVDVADDATTPLGYQMPDIPVNLPGLIVILKPAGWETDVYDVAKFGVPITPVARFYLLSTFLAKNFPRERYPICHSVEHGFGFVHRLDMMSSGLILATTSFECHSLLQWQMASYLIQREYMVLCHGCPGPWAGPISIAARVLEGTARARSTFGERCRTSARGKPAQTRVVVSTHQRLALGEEQLGVLVISIVTGRQHQIRVHLQHIGHPTVYDGRYVEQDVLLAGATLSECTPDLGDRPRLRPLPEKHRAELSLRGAYPWQK